MALVARLADQPSQCLNRRKGALGSQYWSSLPLVWPSYLVNYGLHTQRGLCVPAVLGGKGKPSFLTSLGHSSADSFTHGTSGLLSSAVARSYEHPLALSISFQLNMHLATP